MNSDRTQARREWFVVRILTILGAVIRFWSFGRMGLTHFDEGVYALSGLWAVSPKGIEGLDPMVLPYAPPGFPILVGLAYLILGVSDVSALLVSLACGVATIPVAAWVSRRTLGPGAGAACAAFATLAMAHVAFSRKALTDSPFLLAWLVALGLGGRFLERPRIGRALALGVAVGIAQNLKYNGWIAGLVVVLAAVFGLIGGSEQRRPSALVRTFGLGFVAALVAAAAYWPWFRFVESHGGYADLLRHQRSYLGGPSVWVSHVRQQLAQVVALSGGRAWAMLTWAVAWLGCAVASHVVETGSRWDRARLRVGLLLGAAVLASYLDLGWWVGLAWVPWLFLDARPAVRLLAAWWFILSLMTPFYHPYARLWLPLHAAGWILLSGSIVSLGPFSENLFSRWDRATWTRPAVLARCAWIVLCGILARWQVEKSVAPLPLSTFALPTDTLRDVVADLGTMPRLSADPSTPLLVLARRPVAYYLALQGKIRFQTLAGPEALLGGPSSYKSRDLVLLDRTVAGRQYLNDVAELPYLPFWRETRMWTERLDPVTLLDVRPEAAFEGGSTEQTILILLEPKPPLWDISL